MQAASLLAPSAELLYPGAQKVQAVLPGALANFPAGHLLQAAKEVAPLALDAEPRGQGRQSDGR